MSIPTLMVDRERFVFQSVAVARSTVTLWDLIGQVISEDMKRLKQESETLFNDADMIPESLIT